MFNIACFYIIPEVRPSTTDLVTRQSWGHAPPDHGLAILAAQLWVTPRTHRTFTASSLGEEIGVFSWSCVFPLTSQILCSSAAHF
jgi:hypothetical protein